MNVVVLIGVLSSDPVIRQLPSGDQLCTLQLTTEVAGQTSRTSVPVAVVGGDGPPRWTAGDRLVVVGTVHRRFFRGAAGTASSTEVQAISVLPQRATKRVARALDGVVDQLTSVVMQAAR